MSRCHSSKAIGEGVTGTAALIGQNRDLVHQVGMLPPAGRNGVGSLPDVIV